MSDLCQDCLQAALREWHGFKATCGGCCARSASRSHQYFDAKRDGKLGPHYKSLLSRFGLEHKAVKAAYDADALNKSSN